MELWALEVILCSVLCEALEQRDHALQILESANVMQFHETYKKHSVDLFPPRTVKQAAAQKLTHTEPTHKPHKSPEPSDSLIRLIWTQILPKHTSLLCWMPHILLCLCQCCFPSLFTIVVGYSSFVSKRVLFFFFCGFGELVYFQHYIQCYILYIHPAAIGNNSKVITYWFANC